MISDESRRIGLRIREERIKRGITQNALGYAIGYTGAKIHRLEHGYHEITAELTAAIARELGMQSEELLKPPQHRAVSYMSVKTVRGISRPRKE